MPPLEIGPQGSQIALASRVLRTDNERDNPADQKYLPRCHDLSAIGNKCDQLLPVDSKFVFRAPSRQRIPAEDASAVG